MELHYQDAIALADGMPRPTRMALDKVLHPDTRKQRPRGTSTKRARDGTPGRTVMTRREDEPISLRRAWRWMRATE
jgi:hypothetical protein